MLVTLWYNFVGKESCIDSVNIHQIHDGQVGKNRLVIVPDFKFICNGRIISIRARVEKNSNSTKFPSFQVWRPSSVDSPIYNKVDEVNMSLTDQVTNNILYIKLTGNNAIEFQPGDVIGYYHPFKSRYLVTHIKNNTIGYVLYRFDAEPLENSAEVNINRGKTTKHAHPLLQFTIGMIYVTVWAKTRIVCTC